MTQMTEEIQAETAPEKKFLKTPEKENIHSINELKIFYLLQVNGDPEFRLNSKSARKKDVKTEFLPEGWVYQNIKDAEEVAKRWTKGKRKLHVVRWYEPRLDAIWNGSKDQARLAKKSIKLEIDTHRLNKKKEEIELQCYSEGLHHSWLCAEFLSEEMSEKDKKIHAHFKPLWDKTFEEQAEINLRADDIARETEDYNDAKEEKSNSWANCTIPSGYVLDEKGVWKVTKNQATESEKEASETIIKISDPLWVEGRSRDYSGSNSGLIICWVDMDAITRKTCIERRKLHVTGNPIAEELAHNNLAIVPGKEKELIKYLSAFTIDKTYRSVKSLGWLENPHGDLIYVSKNRTFRSRDSHTQEEFIFQTGIISENPAPFECNGTLEEWKEHIAIPCHGNKLPIFLQSAALAGTIVKHADTGSYGFHVSGITSRGKTTAAQTATSTTGCGADPAIAAKLSIIRRWLATANALESIAAQSNDSVLVLDEIGQCPNADLDKVIYNLFGGRGKERLTQQAAQKATRDWCTVVISTGERTLEERLKETNSKAPAGLFVRFIDLHIEMEAFDDYHGEDHKAFTDKLKMNSGLFYGTPAAAFTQKIVDIAKTPQDLRERISNGCTSIAKEIATKSHLSQEHSRVLKLFSFTALVGIWASEWGIFPYSREEVINSARILFEKWLGGNQKQSEDIKCICAIRDYYLKKRDSAFRPCDLPENEIKRFSDIYGYTTKLGKFYLTKEGFEQALGGLNKTLAKKNVFKKNYLLKEESPTRYDSKKTISGIGSPRVFVFSEKICEFDEEMV